MSTTSTSVDLAMPIGLPPRTASTATHYAALATRLNASNVTGNTLKIWVVDDVLYSGVFTMSKGLLRYIPPGGTAPDGSTTAAPMLVHKIWLWDYLRLRAFSAGGPGLPKQMAIGNLDAAAVQTAIHSEIASSPRYAALSASEKARIETDFLAGTTRILVSAGTLVARAVVDPTVTFNTTQTYRRCDLQLIDENGANLDPRTLFGLWGAVGGPLVAGNPLLSVLQLPISPITAPVEGDTRIRIKGTGFVSGTTVSVDGQPALEVWVRSNGEELYATVPTHAAGSVDIVVSIPGHAAVTYAAALTYVKDVAAAASAVVESLVVRLTEIRDRANDLAASGLLTAQEKNELSLATDIARDAAPLLIEQRARAEGASALSPDIMSVWNRPELKGLFTVIRTAVG